jgi:hypothetical protein
MLHFCLQEERKGKIDSELATVISSISLACKQIAAAVGRSGISSLTGVAGTGENVQVRWNAMIFVISVVGRPAGLLVGLAGTGENVQVLCRCSGMNRCGPLAQPHNSAL